MKTLILLCFWFFGHPANPKNEVTAGRGPWVRSMFAPSNIFNIMEDVPDDSDDIVYTTTPKPTTVVDAPSKLRRCYLDCIDETHVNPDLVMKFKAGSWREYPALKRWALCVLVKMGLMSNQGVFRYDVALSKINFEDQKEVDQILDDCLSQQRMPPQDIAWTYLKCHRKRDKNNRFPALTIFYTL